MSQQCTQSRRERLTLAVAAALLLLLAATASYLTIPSVAWAGATDPSGLADRSAPSTPVYESAVDLYVMPGREY